MIRHLRGAVLFKDLKSVCIDAGGVGYAVAMPLGELARLGGPGHEVSVHVHTQLREGAIDLYGFLSPEGLTFFQRLISVGGVGPKSALVLMSGLDVDELVTAITQGDEARLCRAPGIGKKTAARIVLELRDALKKDGLGPAPKAVAHGANALDDLRSALENLGYRAGQIEKAVDAVAPLAAEGEGVDVLVREALKRV